MKRGQPHQGCVLTPWRSKGKMHWAATTGSSSAVAAVLELVYTTVLEMLAMPCQQLYLEA
jgi:hypothetical protein